MDALADALDWANRTREFRRAFVQRCADGLSLADVRSELAAADHALTGPEVDRLAELRLLPVLEAMPAIGGKIASRRLIAAAGLAEDVELGAIDDAAWTVLLEGAPAEVAS